MPHDATRLSDTRAWIRKASEDLRAARHDRTADPPLLGDAAFHWEQAVEKALKAFLTAHLVTVSSWVTTGCSERARPSCTGPRT